MADRDNLSGLFRPKSIALVGASEKSVWSNLTYGNFAACKYKGKVHLVNRRGQETYGRATATTCAAIGEEVDTALLMVPFDGVTEAIEDVAKAGIRNVVLLTSGFAETGPEGIRIQAALGDQVRRHGMTLLGPNSLGFMNYADGTPLTPVPVKRGFLRGPVAVVTQSGALGTMISKYAAQQGIGLSYLISSGNEADLDAARIIDFLLDDPETKAIAFFAETIRNPQTFTKAAERALSAGKPIVILKVGSSELTSAVARAHTGALVGNDKVFDAACRRLGLIRVRSLEDLITTAALLAHTGPLKAPGLGFVSLSGGACEIFADRAEPEAVPLPPLTPEALAGLKAALPAYATPANPLDITGAVIMDPSLFETCIPMMAMNKDVGLVACVYDLPQTLGDQKRLATLKTLTHIAEGLKNSGVPGILMSHAAQQVTNVGRSEIRKAGLPMVLPGLEISVKAIGHAFEWTKLRETALARQKPAPVPPCGARPRSETETLAHLQSCGVSVVPFRLAQNAGEAAEAARAQGFPAVLKIASPDIEHKSDIGGVMLNLTHEKAVTEAYDLIMARAKAAKPDARLDGVIVAPMRKAGVELIVGVTRDPVWGPVLAVGLGGIWVELLEDVSLRLLPVTTREVKDMLGELKSIKLLQGFRGSRPVDLDCLAEEITRIGDAALALGPELAALEINPLLADGQAIEALDALAIWN